MTRRSFFELLVAGCTLFVAGAVGILALIAGVSPSLGSRQRENWRPVARLNDLPIGAVHEGVIPREGREWPKTLRQRAVFVWRRSEEDLVVFSRSCTDLGCPLDYDPGSTCFFCPCHGGIFSQDGKRMAGPPNGPMFRYAHRVRDGALEIDISSVPAGV